MQNLFVTNYIRLNENKIVKKIIFLEDNIFNIANIKKTAMKNK